MPEKSLTYEDPVLATDRLLTEVYHFLEYMDAAGNVPDAVFEDVAQNRETGACEIGIPSSITTTYHNVVEWVNETGKRERMIRWLGRSAIEVAESGYEYHFSKPAYERVAIEIAAAHDVQETLRPGTAKPFISPRMTRHDASVAVAKAEHLYADDSVYVSTAITNEWGAVTGRKLQSILVKGIPFEAWVTMLKDSNNIFGKSLQLTDEQSATSVMELFSQLDLPEELLPHGPVTLVEAVLPYIADEIAWHEVVRQLDRFYEDQAFYAHEAQNAGEEWALFDLELARSLLTGWATDTVRFFLMQNADAWSDESLDVINANCLTDTQYAMTTQFAALLAQAKQKLIGDRLSVVTNNEDAIREVPPEVRREIIANHRMLAIARKNNASLQQIRRIEQMQYQLLHQYNIRSGGGCPGEVESAFGGPEQGPDGVGEYENPFKPGWRWKMGVCRVAVCPSPKPTEVGPCDVCHRCQREFDAGRDPTKARPITPRTQQAVGGTALAKKPWGSVEIATTKKEKVLEPV